MTEPDAITENAEIKPAVSTVAHESLEHSRLRRAYRYMAASKLLHLSSLVDEDTASRVMKDIDIASLDSLPHWCLLEDTLLLELQRIAGAVFTAPAIRRCIDGSRLGDWQSLLGAQLFDQAVAASAQLEHQVSPDLPPACESLLLSSGSSVLFSTVQAHPASPLLKKRFVNDPEEIPEQTALAVYTLAASLQQLVPIQKPATAPRSESLSHEQNTTDMAALDSQGIS